MGVPDLPSGNIISPVYERLVKQITYEDSSIELGVLRRYNWVYNVHVHVVESFDGSSPALEVGYSGNDDAYMASIGVGSIGLKAVTLGSGIGYDSSARKAVITRTGSGATQGKALVILEFFLVPKVN